MSVDYTSANKLKVGDHVDVSMGWTSQTMQYKCPELWNLTIGGSINVKGFVERIEQKSFGKYPRLWTVVHVNDGEIVWHVVDPEEEGDFEATILQATQYKTLRSGKQY